MTIDDSGNLGSLHIAVYADGDVFRWFVIDHEQQREGHQVIVAQGAHLSPFFAEAMARQARTDLIEKADRRLTRELKKPATRR